MKPVIIIAIAFVLLIPIPIFAETFEIRILEGSSTSGCENNDSCLSPSEITILKGDTVNWIREEDTSHFIQSYTDSQFNWATMDYSHKFKDAGIFHYTISEMPWIQGVINVRYTQSVDGIPNNVKFTSVEKIDDSLHLEMNGHLDTISGVLHVFSESGQLIVNIGVPANDDGTFTYSLIDPDDFYWEWISGDYRTEFWSVDGDNGNKKSEIIEGNFILNTLPEPIVCPQGFEPVNGVCPDKPVILQEQSSEISKQKVPDWVKNIFGWYAQDKVSEDELLGAIKYLIDEGILKVD